MGAPRLLLHQQHLHQHLHLKKRQVIVCSVPLFNRCHTYDHQSYLQNIVVFIECISIGGCGSFISWKKDDDDYDGKGNANNWSKPAAASCCESAAVAGGEKGRTHYPPLLPLRLQLLLQLSAHFSVAAAVQCPILPSTPSFYLQAHILRLQDLQRKLYICETEQTISPSLAHQDNWQNCTAPTSLTRGW